jgi:hypothetical protein
MSDEIHGEVQINDGTGRALKYTFTKEVIDGLIKQGIDVQKEIEQALTLALEEENIIQNNQGKQTL